MNKFTKQCVAAFASLAMAGTLCVAGAVVTNNVAFATDDAQTATNADAPWNTANKDKKGSIKITKYEDDGTGNRKGALKGAKFKVTPVVKLNGTAIDLKNYDDWLKVAAKVPTLNADPNSLVSTDFGDAIKNASAEQNAADKTLFETDNNGEINVPDLPIGLYKVEEVASAPGHANDVAPFFMTIPEITHEANKPVKYSYAVTVDAKNQSLANKITKTLVRTDGDGTEFVGAGDTMSYKISADILSNSDTKRTEWTKEDLNGYTVFDQAPVNVFTTYDNTVVQSVDLVYKKDNSTKTEHLKDNAIIAVEDIKKGGNETDKDTVVAKRIKVSFNDTALGTIATAAKADNKAKIEIEFKFTLTKDYTKVTGSSFTNQSGFIMGKGKNKKTPKPEVPTDGGSQVESHYGYLQVNKYDGTFASTSTDNGAKLANAKFKLFAKKSDADACAANTNAAECGKASKVGELTTVAGGKFQNAVRVVIDDTTHPFYIVETEAPANYERDQKAHAVTVADSTTANSPKVVDIANVPTKDNGSWFKLPKTGAYGIIIFAIAGIALIVASIFIYTRNNRKEENKQRA